MKCDLTYDGEIITLDIPDSVSVDQFSPSVVENQVDSETFKSRFLRAGGERFIGVGKLLIVINDGHRNTPTPRILSLLREIDPAIVDNADYVIAAGTHDAPSDEHYMKIFGEHHDRLRPRSRYHDARDYSRMRKIGVDWFNKEVWVNSALFDYENIMMISSVEPHYFAGFTGGRKSVLPGLADFATIERNHNQANSLEAAPLKIAGNPVAEHMASVLDIMGAEKFFGVQGVIDAHKNLSGVFFGDLKTAFETAVEFSMGIYAHKITERYDAVICELLPPLDNNLYQIQKALENCQPAVKDGGRIVLLSACKGGVGSEHFFQLASGWDSEKNVAKDGELHFGSHKLSRVNTIGRRIDVCVYSTLPAKTLQRVFYQRLDDIHGFLGEKKPEGYRIAIVRDAGHTVLTT